VPADLDDGVLRHRVGFSLDDDAMWGDVNAWPTEPARAIGGPWDGRRFGIPRFPDGALPDAFALLFRGAIRYIVYRLARSDDLDGTHPYRHDERADFEALEAEHDASIRLDESIEHVGPLVV
jgi:hypothetical protein